jgi:hypothetical protein
MTKDELIDYWDEFEGECLAKEDFNKTQTDDWGIARDEYNFGRFLLDQSDYS